MPILQHWNEIGQTAASPSVTKRVMPGSAVSLVHVAIKAGTKADRHAYAFEQFVQIIEGHGTLETEEGVQRFSAGSVFHFPPNTWHAASFEADTVLVETNVGA